MCTVLMLVCEDKLSGVRCGIVPREEVAISDGMGRGQVKCFFVWRMRSVRVGRQVGVEGMEDEDGVDVEMDMERVKRRRGVEALITCGRSEEMVFSIVGCRGKLAGDWEN
jgi:hypothetical protein